jgi:uncharacterized protein (DUF1697 family)
MSALRNALEEAGITVRQTYLQSGNVVFDAPRAPASELAARIEAAVQPKLARATAAVVLSARGLGQVLADAPADWGTDESTFAHHLVFVVPPVTARQVLAGRQFDADVDRVSSKGRIIYWSIRNDAQAPSGMTRLARTPAYRNITVRTHAVVRQLHALTGSS